MLQWKGRLPNNLYRTRHIYGIKKENEPTEETVGSWFHIPVLGKVYLCIDNSFVYWVCVLDNKGVINCEIKKLNTAHWLAEPGLWLQTILADGLLFEILKNFLSAWITSLQQEPINVLCINSLIYCGEIFSLELTDMKGYYSSWPL